MWWMGWQQRLQQMERKTHQTNKAQEAAEPSAIIWREAKTPRTDGRLPAAPPGWGLSVCRRRLNLPLFLSSVCCCCWGGWALALLLAFFFFSFLFDRDPMHGIVISDHSTLLGIGTNNMKAANTETSARIVGGQRCIISGWAYSIIELSLWSFLSWALN